MSRFFIRFSKPRSDLFAITQFLPIAIFQHSLLCSLFFDWPSVSALRRLDADPVTLVRTVMSQHRPDHSCHLVSQCDHHDIRWPALA